LAVEQSTEALAADLESRFGNRFICEEVPDHRLPQSGMPAPEGGLHESERRHVKSGAGY
jgi:hypothetical protein